jgi:predicted ATP-grasp superfamily ATP-dependent carboligase
MSTPYLRLFLYEYLSGGGLVAQGEAGLLAEGRAMRDAVAAGLPPRSLTLAGQAGESGCRSALPGETQVEFVAREAAAHDAVWVIAPETDGLLLALCQAVPPAHWIGCSAGAIALASSKRRTIERLREAGLPVPRPGLDRAGRWVVKPDDGAGAVATRVVPAAPVTASYSEPWVDGEPMSLSLQVRRHGVELLAVNRQRIELANDGTLHAGLPLPAVLRPDDARWALLQRLADGVVAAIPGLAGFVGIDFVWHPEAGPVLIEVNPRVTSALVGLDRALPAQLLQGWMDDR